MKIARKKSRPKAKNYHHGDLKNSILEVSLVLLRDIGPHAFNIRELAKKLDVSGAAPYRHFKSKEEIFFRLAERGFQALNARFKEAIKNAPLAPRKQLTEIALCYLDFSKDYPEQFKLMTGDYLSVQIKQQDPSLNQAATEVFMTLIAVVQSCQLAKDLPAPSPSDVLMIKIWSTIHGLTLLAANGAIAGTLQQEKNLKELAVEAVDAMIAGLMAKCAN